MPSRTATRGRRQDPADAAKPTRVTVDLEPGDYDSLREWAHVERMTHSDVLRALVRILASDDDVATKVRES